MTLEITRDRFGSIVNFSRGTFLNRLAGIHVQWHMSNEVDGSLIGFLSFHREMIKYNRWNLANNDLRPMRMAFNFSEIVEIMPWDSSILNASSARGFSRSVERWHNIFHNSAAEAGWTDFEDPRLNIRDSRFWRFHKFLNNRFSQWLRENDLRYSEIDHDSV
jgi:hypothetical protein